MRVWDASTGAELWQLNGHTNRVNSVAFSHDGIYIVSGSSDMSVRVWSASTDAELHQLNGHIVSGSHVTSIWVRNEIYHGFLWTHTKDGWIVSLTSQDRLMWIPQGIYEVVCHPYNILTISQKGYVHIDFQGFKVGSKWVECYKPLSV